MPLKNDLLVELELNRGTDLSGQMLAEKLGVSRNAVWKAVNYLKKDGYEILSSTNRGYRLADDSDLLSAEGIKGYLSIDARELDIFCYKELDSTNNEAKRKLANGFSGNALIVAECQTAGRGRNGHDFYSPKTGAYMTLILHPGASFEDTTCITAAAAVAVAKSIEALTDKKPKIKWVNDIFLDGGKIAGILTEAIAGFEERTVQSVIVGIGINIKQTDFPKNIKDIATFLDPSGITRNRLVAEIANQILRLSQNLSDKAFMDEYREHSMVLGKRIEYCSGDKLYFATAVGIDNSAGLLIQHEDGSRETLKRGEISIRLDRNSPNEAKSASKSGR